MIQLKQYNLQLHHFSITSTYVMDKVAFLLSHYTFMILDVHIWGHNFVQHIRGIDIILNLQAQVTSQLVARSKRRGPPG